MCTVSIFLAKGKLLLTANRDESRSRGEDGLKQIQHNNIACLYPVDSKSQGTWLGVNDFGIVAAILNMYQANYQGSQSRGFIIPELLKYKSLSQACDYTQSLNPKLYSPFVLLLMDNTNLYRFSWDGVSMSKETLSVKESIVGGFLESSSSVEPDNIIPYRQKLFQQWQQDKSNEDNKAAKILTFHLMRDTDKPSASVCMSRPNGHTKSICQIALNKSEIEFHYLAPEKLESMVNVNLDQAELSALETVKLTLQEINSPKNLSTKICSV